MNVPEMDGLRIQVRAQWTNLLMNPWTTNSLSPNKDYIPCLLAYCEYPGDPFKRIEDQEGVEFFGCTDEKLFGPDVDLMEASTQAGFYLI